MSWLSVALVALLVAVILFPALEPHLTRKLKSRKAHRGGIVHCYPNYDEDLNFEPRHAHDIIAVARRDLEGFDYRPGNVTAVVPRTFRNRVSGDERLRLWSSRDEMLRPLWICTWHGLDLVPLVTMPQLTFHLTRELLVRVESGPVRTIAHEDDELMEGAILLYCHEPEPPPRTAVPANARGEYAETNTPKESQE